TQAVTGVPPPQVPDWQSSPIVQASRSSHGSPFIRLWVVHCPVLESHTPSTQSWVSEEQSFWVPPVQTPPAQVLLTAQRSDGSTQGTPSLPGTGSHMPVAGLHSETWQSFGTGWKKQSLGVPTHRPFWQVPSTWQRSWLLVHVEPFGKAVRLQLLQASSQVTSSQSPGPIPQSFCDPPAQVPAPSQASSMVQKRPSSQGVPAARATTSHCASAALQIASWQASVLMALQSTPQG